MIAGGKVRRLAQVDDLDRVAPGEMGLADALEIGQRRYRFPGLAGNVEPKLERRGRTIVKIGHRGFGSGHASSSSRLSTGSTAAPR